jgi:GTP pyrophosphokinase
MVKSTATRNKIKAFFTKNDREIYIERGKYSLEKELRKRKLVFSEFLTDENIKKICDAIKVEDLDEIYLSIGNGKATVNGVINVIDKIEEVVPPKNVKVSSKNIDADIIVSGIDKVKVNLANCCNPVYGDEIIGYITKGNGISIHRITCHNLENVDERIVDVSWNDNSNKRYLTCLLLYLGDNENHMLDIVQSVSMMNISVDGIKVMNKGDKCTYELECYVTGLDQLNKLILNLEKHRYVERVERAMR